MSNNSIDRDGVKGADDQADTFDFTSTYTANFPKILKALNLSLAVTSYQSSRLIFLRSTGESLDTRFTSFPRPMGVYADSERLTLGTLNQVLEFRRSDALWRKIKAGELDNTEQFGRKTREKDPEEWLKLERERNQSITAIKDSDALYLHRAALTTGMINIHDIAWGHEGLWVVNSTFSCLSTLSSDFSFVARWQPPFITHLAPEDRCHLNGMAMLDGAPRYVTTFNKGDRIDAWAHENYFNGTLIDVPNNRVLFDDLVLPHSPRCHKGEVFYCNSGAGEVVRVDPTTLARQVVCRLPGFTRGLYFIDDLMLVGVSKIRESERASTLPISDRLSIDDSCCGIWMIDLRDGAELGWVRFDGDVYQIYDIAALPGCCYPEILTEHDALARHLFEFKRERMQ